MKKMSLAVVIGFVVAVWAMPAMAFTVIPSPDAAYLAGTTLIDISGIADFTSVGSITDGTETVTFGAAQEKRTAPGGGWATWSATPDSERLPAGTAGVLYSLGATGVTMTLSKPAYTFGFEAEPNPFSVLPMTAKYYDEAGGLLGSILRSVDGSGGARLFAASVDPIKSVEFSCDSCDFATAYYRYDLTKNGVPEPATLLLLGSGLIGLVAYRRKISK